LILTTILVLLTMLALSIPVAAVLGALALVLSQLYSFLPLHLAVGELAWVSNINVILVAVPLFILLGEILLRCHVRGHFGLQRGDRRDHRHGGHRPD